MMTMKSKANVNWAAKVVIAASIAFVPVVASPAVGHVQAAAEQSLDGYASKELKELHAKVDAYVFVDHAEELAAEGIQVTNTGPVGDYIEIGILDYSEEKAAYLGDAFDSPLVKVVEGIQAVTLDNTLQIATDGEQMSTTSVEAPAAGAGEVAVTTAADAGTVGETSTAAKGSVATWVIVVAAAALAAIAFASRKLTQAKK
ncbi:hypothetical protein [Paenibacillus arenilitoris]|uniref:NEAT domain-containing protein n=1 Tax=Paenibacillus arenilitoris TaxID=2772299 RepID=A0A927CQR5_9BACL|nr:hypothetical protein [Paenibacillus arenilitoris]MBD2869920.1 hypothetical protein [Paenibacillus arenilitoris]